MVSALAVEVVRVVEEVLTLREEQPVHRQHKYSQC